MARWLGWPLLRNVCAFVRQTFLAVKADKLKNQQREYEAQMQYRQHLQVQLSSMDLQVLYFFIIAVCLFFCLFVCWFVCFARKAYVDRWRYNAKRAPQVQSKLKILEKL